MSFSQTRFATADDALRAVNKSLEHEIAPALGKRLVAEEITVSESAYKDAEKRIDEIIRRAIPQPR